MEKTCEFNCKEKCTWMGDECIHPEIVCFAKNNVVMPKISVMQPTVKNEDNTIPVTSENVASGEILCKSGNPVKYRDCPDYNSAFCRAECNFGPKEAATFPGLDSDK